MLDLSNSRRAVMFAAMLLVAAPDAAQPPQRPADAPLQIRPERTFSFDMRFDPQTIAAASNTGAAGLAWRATVQSRFPQGGALDGIRVHVRLDAPLPPGQTLRVLSAAGAEIDAVTSSAANPVRDLWSREVPDGRAVLELTRTAPGQSPGATIQYAYHVIPLEQQAISGKNQLMPIEKAPFRIKQLGKSVARLRFMVPGQGQATCTAFVVGERLILTNEHCISNDDERASALVDFNYDTEDSRPGEIRVSEIVSTNRGLDYTLLRLASAPPEGTGRLHFVPDTWKWTPAPDPHALVIVQHPSGRPKQVSMTECTMEGIDRVGVTPGDKSDFGHVCDTLGGSSGSPVIDFDTRLVVGLHHFGFVEGSKDPVNQAVVHTRILAHIKSKDPAAHAEMIKPRP